MYVPSGFFTKTKGDAYGASERSITPIANISSISLLMTSCILYGMGYDLCFTSSVSVNSTLCSIRCVTFGTSEKISLYSLNISRICVYVLCSTLDL